MGTTPSTEHRGRGPSLGIARRPSNARQIPVHGDKECDRCHTGSDERPIVEFDLVVRTLDGSGKVHIRNAGILRYCQVCWTKGPRYRRRKKGRPCRTR